MKSALVGSLVATSIVVCSLANAEGPGAALIGAGAPQGLETVEANALAPDSAPANAVAPDSAPANAVAPASAPANAVAPASAPAKEIAPASAPVKETAPASAPASAPSTPSESHAHHSFSDTDRYVAMFEDPTRMEWQKPQEVVAALKLSAGQAVADIGSGSGYFTIPLARSVGPDGRVYAVDIEPGMIDYVTKRAKKEHVGNVVAILADRSDAKLPPASVDLVFICNTWHHIDDRVPYLRRLAPALKAGARIAIVDYQKRPLPVGPPPEAKLDRSEVIKEFKEAGFVLVDEPAFLPHQYFLVFSAARSPG